MSVQYCDVTQKLGLRIFPEMALQLLEGHTYGINQRVDETESRYPALAAIIPWQAVKFLGQDTVDDFMRDRFRQDARAITQGADLNRPVSGKIRELNFGRLASNTPATLRSVLEGDMTILWFSRQPVGLFVPLPVLCKLAGDPVAPEVDGPISSGIARALAAVQGSNGLRQMLPTGGGQPSLPKCEA